MDDRIHFVEHKGKKVLVFDFSNADAHQMQLLLEYIRVTVAQHARTENIPHAFLENFHSFSQRDLPTFKTREEALDWLVAS